MPTAARPAPSSTASSLPARPSRSIAPPPSPGGVPNTPHKHRQSDIILIREGTVAFEHDGKSEHVGPGGVIFVASQTMHTLRNVGDVEAKYFVVIISRESNATLVNAR